MIHPSKPLPDTFRRIRLERAREAGRPAGDPGVGYTLLAPLTADGHLDVEAARAFRDACKVIRFRHGRESDEGYLHRRPGGSWAFHYNLPDGEEDDDPGYRLGAHRFVSGEYVTFIEDEGEHTYRVASVEPLTQG